MSESHSSEQMLAESSSILLNLCLYNYKLPAGWLPANLTHLYPHLLITMFFTADICRPIQAGILWLPAAGFPGADGISAGWTSWGPQPD